MTIKQRSVHAVQAMLQTALQLLNGSIERLKKIDFEAHSRSALLRLTQLRVKDLAMGLATVLAIACLPVLLKDGFEAPDEKVSVSDQVLAAIQQSNRQPRRLPQALTSKSYVAPELNLKIAGLSTTVVEPSSTVFFDDNLRELKKSEIGAIIASALETYAELGEGPRARAIKAFGTAVPRDENRFVSNIRASWGLSYLLEAEDLYISLVPADQIPALIASELEFYKKYKAIDPVGCGELPLLIDLSEQAFPTSELRAAALDIQKRKSRQSAFALSSPVLRAVPRQDHYDAIMKLSADGGQSVEQLIEKYEQTPPEEFLAFQCKLAFNALQYIQSLEDDVQKIGLYERMFGSQFTYVKSETHSDYMLPEQMMLFSSLTIAD